MTTHKLSELQALVLETLPDNRQSVALTCSDNGYHQSSVYRAINTLIRRGLITIDDSGTLRPRRLVLRNSCEEI